MSIRLFLLVLLIVPCWIIAAQYEIDLVNLHYVSQLLHADLSRIYARNGNLGRYFYGPFSLILIKPLGLLSFIVVKWFWIVLQTLAFVYFWNAFAKLYPQLSSRAALWAWIGVWILAINPIHNNFQSNNIQLMLAAAILWSELWTYESAKKGFLAGVCVALCAAIKIFPGFLAVYYLVFKKSPVRWGVLVGSAFALVSPLVFFGLDSGGMLYRDFLFNLTDYGVENSLVRVPDILCLPSWFERSGVSPLITRLTILTISAVFFAYAWSVRNRLNAQSERLLWGLALALMVFLNPSTRPHYFIFYVPAFASLVQYAYTKGKATSWASLAVVLGMISFTAEGITGKPLNDALEHLNIPTYGMLILLFLCTWRLVESNDDGDALYVP